MHINDMQMCTIHQPVTVINSCSESVLIGYFSVLYYTNCASLKSICASLNVKLCIFKNHFTGEGMKFGHSQENR